MLRSLLLSAGVVAALVIGGPEGVAANDASPSDPPNWVSATVQDVTPGLVYRLEGCVTVLAPGATNVSLRIAWHDQPNGYGPAVYKDALANPTVIGKQQCLSIANADAPCEAISVRYGVFVVPDTAAIQISSLTFTPQPGATPLPCPTTPPAPPTPTPTATPPTPPQPPSPTPHPTIEEPAEPLAFPTLVNGGFEEPRDDGTPYGWRKIGGEMSTSTTTKAEGQRSAKLTSKTQSTKWLYQSVSVEGGRHYRLRAQALMNDPALKEALLRVSWYISADGSGSQIATADSQPLTATSQQWTELDTGALLSPPQARSARLRLMVRPAAAAAATAYFDDVRFEKVSAPPSSASAPAEDAPAAAAGGARTSTGAIARSEPAVSAGSTFWKGPRPLANVKRHADDERPPPAQRDDVPLWPLVLATAVPAAGLALLAGDAWHRSRIAGVDEPRL
jgi:hypothetical protein